MRTLLFAAMAVLLAISAQATEQTSLPLFRQVAGEIRSVTVEAGDTLFSLGAALGVRWKTIAALNRIADPNRIYPGQVLSIDTRRIVPVVVDEGVVINIPEATLYRFETGVLSARYPVGLGRPQWPTPVGSFTVLFAENDPTRDPPDSIEEELEREGRVVHKKASPEPDAPLGKHWIQLSTWGYGIHGTPFISTVGQFASHGCIRLDDAGMERLYPNIKKGTKVEITNLPVKVAVTPNGEVWAEAHTDVYGLGIPEKEEILQILEREGVSDRVQAAALATVLELQEGVARRIGAPPAQPNETEVPAEAEEDSEFALWRCLDCPPGPNRRVTFQIEALSPIDLPNPFPIEIRDDAGQVVYRPQMMAQAIVSLTPEQTRNFVWEVRDTEGQPLPPGSYVAVISFFAGDDATKKTLWLPLWLGK